MEARGWNRTIRKKVLLTPAFPLGYRALTVYPSPFIRLPGSVRKVAKSNSTLGDDSQVTDITLLNTSMATCLRCANLVSRVFYRPPGPVRGFCLFEVNVIFTFKNVGSAIVS
jgi:hypothetical protein